ncbi:glycosyl transferase group 1 [Parvibaculum lavamentivorans DS-1]|uniref:Glycosyl transferase group 1 n=1 Tax=Parvibaculum lavamentivorans (strain DS-1 / DSM 13023 / NCIMB 13966) TaxID=402881 RepID=A7HXH5_PARL1|nr:glycosyltransferase [Parvibaculum lavamentivorans]ABS64608.1 glycosyl transferase group 1 [Parvibaculum lavamentivorans DS-1]
MASPAHSENPHAVRKVLHVMRLPMGGLFRHVRDLVAGQQAAGIAAGVICAEPPADDGVSARRLAELAPKCGLGLHVIPMGRLPGVGDAVNIREVRALADWLKPDVLHGHGAKGGMLARLAPRDGARVVRVYTPHGGSLHYNALSPQGFVYHTAERLMRRRTDGLIFESEFSRAAYLAKIGRPGAPTAVIHNGLTEDEFLPVPHGDMAADFLFIGELRMLKGVSTLIEAASTFSRPVHIRIVGAGPDRARFEELAKTAGSAARFEFMGAMPAREAFRLGRIAVMPSWNESLPYVALETAAAGIPLIATRVGGMAEIFGPDATRLVPAQNASALAAAMMAALADPEAAAASAARLRARVMTHFSASQMVEGVNGFYDRLLEARKARLLAHTGRLAAAPVAPGLTGAGQ